MDSDSEVHSRTFVIVGYRSDAVTSRLKASGIYYIAKSLDSGPSNWAKIAEHIEAPGALGAIVKLVSADVSRMRQEPFKESAQELLKALAGRRHLLLAHEDILSAEDDGDSKRITQNPNVGDFIYRRDYFCPPDKATRDWFLDEVERNRLNLMLYKSNAELHVLASTFVEQSENNLVFRLYVPSSRLWAREAEKLLSLFREWLSRVKGERVRQDGYHTGQGQVFEFYVDSTEGSEPTPFMAFEDFSQFLELCGDDPEAAARMLAINGTEPSEVPEIIRRFSKEVNRVRRDIRQEREARLLSIRHRLENELTELSDEKTLPTTAELAAAVNDLVPQAGAAARTALAASPEFPHQQNVNVLVKPQIISHVHGVVAQEVQGSVHFGAEAQEILKLIEQHGDERRAELLSSLHELEDADAQSGPRLAASSRLRTFLLTLAKRADEIATPLLIKYLERKSGLTGS